MAVDDDLIRKNPFEFQLATVVVNDSADKGSYHKKAGTGFSGICGTRQTFFADTMTEFIFYLKQGFAFPNL